MGTALSMLCSPGSVSMQPWDGSLPDENPDRASTLSTKCQNRLAVWGVKHMGDSFYPPHGVLGGT